jgi:hypothetical protein
VSQGSISINFFNDNNREFKLKASADLNLMKSVGNINHNGKENILIALHALGL